MVSSTFKRILVPLDGSELATQAISPAQMVAQQTGAELILFRVVPEFRPEMEIKQDIRLSFSNDEEEQQRLVDEADESLTLLVDSLKIHDINVKSAIGVGEPAEQIVQYVVDNDVDLIVMSSHGYTAVERWAFGSVARKVLDAAKCSVFIVRLSADE